MKKSKILLFIILILVVITTGISFGFFLVGTEIKGEGAKNTGKIGKFLKLTYDALDSTEANVQIANLYPGASGTKKFKITIVPGSKQNSVTYSIIFNIEKNGFKKCTETNFNETTNNCKKNAEELVYSLKEGETEIATGDLTGVEGEVKLANITKENIEETLELIYTLEIKFIDTEQDQNHNAGDDVTLSGSIDVVYDEQPASQKTLAKLEQTSGSKYDVKDQTTFSANSHSTAKEVYKFQDNDGDTYVFRGNPNNWVTFAGKTWRIIRINGDGTLRLLYYCGDTTCSSPTNAASSTTAYKTSPINDNTYVGYYYGTASSSSYETTHKSIKTNKSTIAGVVNTWYETNLKNNYAEKLSGASGWCNDRTISTIKPSNGSYNGNGTGTNASVYGAWGRFVDGSSSSWTTKTPVTPKLTCEQNDLFTTASDKNGNQILDYPIGLITADEVIIGGMLYYGNSSYYETQSYVSAGFSYWTMSPYYSYSTNGYARVFNVHSGGYLDHYYVNNAFGVRPVINVNLDKVQITGKGTKDSRFAIT